MPHSRAQVAEAAGGSEAALPKALDGGAPEQLRSVWQGKTAADVLCHKALRSAEKASAVWV